MPSVGEVWLDQGFLIHDGTVEPHFVVVLGIDRDWVSIRVLTTQSHERPATVGCHLHGFRAGYFIGTPHGIISSPKPTWVDLGMLDDVDTLDFPKFEKNGRYVLKGRLPRNVVCAVLDCAIRSVDRTARQEKRFYAAKQTLGCP